MSDFLRDEAPDLSEVEWPVPDAADPNDDPLFDSTRSYIDQIDRFKEFQGRPTERKTDRRTERKGNAA
jgi:hypothetical protein